MTTMSSFSSSRAPWYKLQNLLSISFAKSCCLATWKVEKYKSDRWQKKQLTTKVQTAQIAEQATNITNIKQFQPISLKISVAADTHVHLHPGREKREQPNLRKAGGWQTITDKTWRERPTREKDETTMYTLDHFTVDWISLSCFEYRPMHRTSTFLGDKKQIQGLRF